MLRSRLVACHRLELVYSPAGVSAGIAQRDWWRPVADPGTGGQGRQTQRRSRDDRPERQHRGEQDKDRCPVNIGPCERACQGRHAVALQAEQEGAATKVLSRGPGSATKLAEARSLERIPPKPLPPIIRRICASQGLNAPPFAHGSPCCRRAARWCRPASPASRSRCIRESRPRRLVQPGCR